MRRINSHSQRGFTVVELTTVVVMIPIIIALFILTLYTISDNSGKQSTQVLLDSGSRNAVRWIEGDVRLSAGFNKTVANPPFSDPYGPDNNGAAWSFAGSSATSRVLILTGIAATQNSDTNSRVPIYIQSPSYSCSGDDLVKNPLYTYRILFFVRDSVLYRRLLTDTSSSLCNGPAPQKQSCPPELVGSWNAICRARDEIVARNVSSFSIDYYTQRATSPIPNIYTDSTSDVGLANDAEITLTLSKTNGNGTTSSTQTLRMSKLNTI